MVRGGGNRGRGAWNRRGGNIGGRDRGGGNIGNVDGPLVTDHLRDLDMELKLLQCKKQIFEQERDMLDRLANATNYSASNQYASSRNQYTGASNQYASASNQYASASNQYFSTSNQYPTSSNNYSNNSGKRQYDNQQPFNTFNNQQGASEQFNFANYTAPYQPGPRTSNVGLQGVKRQANPSVWQNQNPPPLKRAPQNINPWQHNLNTKQTEFRSVNQNRPQPQNFSAQTRMPMAQKPGIGQRLKNQYNPPVERKSFTFNKVNKPYIKPAPRGHLFRSTNDAKLLIEKTNKLIAHTNAMAGQAIKPKPKPKVQNAQSKVLPSLKKQNPSTKVQNPSQIVVKPPPKSQYPAQNITPKYFKQKSDQDNILRPDRQPTGPVKGRLELAMGMVLKSVKELCTDPETLEYFNIPFIQRLIKNTLRVRIRNLMMNQSIGAVKPIVDKYREKYPQDTDYELMKIAQDACEYNNNHRRVLHLNEADDPEEFFKGNVSKILLKKLHDMLNDLQELYKSRDHNVEKLVESFPMESDSKEIEGKDETQENEKMDTSKEQDTNESGMKDTDVENNSDGNQEDTACEKSENVEKGADDEIVKPNFDTTSTEHSSVDGKSALDQIRSRAQIYTEFVEKIMQQKLPYMLHKFKEDFIATMCLDKEFVSMKSLIVLECKSKLRESFMKENTITIDDDESNVTSTKTAAKPATAAGKRSSTAKPASTSTAKPEGLKRATPATTPTKPATKGTKSVDPLSTVSAEGPSAAAKPVDSTTPVKPAAAKPGDSTTPVKPAAAKSLVATSPIKTPQTAKPAPSVTAATPASDKSVPATPKTPASKDIIHYVKLIGRPALPSRAVIFEFLNKFSPSSIKKHKCINNLLVIGFMNKEGFEEILTANESVVGDATIIIKASEQVYIPRPKQTPQHSNKTGQQENKMAAQNKTTDEENKDQQKKTIEEEAPESKIEIDQKITSQDNKMPAQMDNIEESDETDKNEINSSIDEVITSDLESQITDLLSSIRKADEGQEDVPNIPTEPNSEEKMDTITTHDDKDDFEEKESDQNKENKIVDAVKSPKAVEDKIVESKESAKGVEDKIVDAKESTADDSNTAKINLDTIMETDEETKISEDVKAKAVEEVVKTTKESGRATPTRSSSRLANVTPSTIKTRRASRLTNN